MTPHEYPVQYEIERPAGYNRWTVAFRPILAIPQLVLVGGGLYLGFTSHNGVLGAVLSVLALFAWFAILFTGRFPDTMRGFCLMIFRWAANVHAYVTLQAAPYPPFGQGSYPLRLEVEPAAHYNRWTVAFRIFLVIPHVIVLIVLGLAQAIVTVIAWFAILFTGQYPESMWTFTVGVSRWEARVAAYLYLFVDEYPPFTMAAHPQTGTMAPLPA
jgi:hypothetical protein